MAKLRFKPHQTQHILFPPPGGGLCISVNSAQSRDTSAGLADFCFLDVVIHPSSTFSMDTSQTRHYQSTRTLQSPTFKHPAWPQSPFHPHGLVAPPEKHDHPGLTTYYPHHPFPGPTPSCAHFPHYSASFPWCINITPVYVHTRLTTLSLSFYHTEPPKPQPWSHPALHLICTCT